MSSLNSPSSLSAATTAQERAAVSWGHRSATIRAFLLPLTLAEVPGAFFCLFSHRQVVEVLGRRPVQRIPFSHSAVQGLICYADQLLPVIDLNGLCHRGPVRPPGGFRQLVVIRTGAQDPVTGTPLKAALAVNVPVQMTTLSSQMLATAVAGEEAPAALRATGLLRGYLSQPTGGIALIDLSRVVLGSFADASPAA